MDIHINREDGWVLAYLCEYLRHELRCVCAYGLGNTSSLNTRESVRKLGTDLEIGHIFILSIKPRPSMLTKESPNKATIGREVDFYEETSLSVMRAQEMHCLAVDSEAELWGISTMTWIPLLYSPFLLLAQVLPSRAQPHKTKDQSGPDLQLSTGSDVVCGALAIRPSFSDSPLLSSLVGSVASLSWLSCLQCLWPWDIGPESPTRWQHRRLLGKLLYQQKLGQVPVLVIYGDSNLWWQHSVLSDPWTTVWLQIREHGHPDYQWGPGWKQGYYCQSRDSTDTHLTVTQADRKVRCKSLPTYVTLSLQPQEDGGQSYEQVWPSSLRFEIPRLPFPPALQAGSAECKLRLDTQQILRIILQFFKK